jgi:hypothetical protein
MGGDLMRDAVDGAMLLGGAIALAAAVMFAAAMLAGMPAS